MKIAWIICANGLGHYYRSLASINKIRNKNNLRVEFNFCIVGNIDKDKLEELPGSITVIQEPNKDDIELFTKQFCDRETILVTDNLLLPIYKAKDLVYSPDSVLQE